MADTSSSPSPASRLAWLLLLLLAFLAWSLGSGRLQVPDDWNPWAPLDVRATPNALTGLKLRRAGADPEACLEALSRSRLAWTPLPDRTTGDGCGLRNAVRVEGGRIDPGQAFPLSCRAALSLAMWEAHVLQPAARQRTGQAVVAFEHLGSYACRNLYGRPDGRRSRHATADALDLAAFVLADGRRVSVLAHGAADAPGGDEARLLQDLHDGACRYFDAVLGPAYNAAHADHFHFDRGGARVCR
ncbi:extensin family protein [Marilutibacter spongiae]|uniref:Extensin family protein n=1 Tax=Marilutibacter spongiae TaxID=2025720 RepID=A0A7W3TJJ6_9GAMM|nr:extensin family protein [Lysobacter spongiae]MBB1059527.1 extensin family protein [Lysobacter spongiae]